MRDTSRHQDSADELVRVCRPGGTIGLINWTPQGFVGQMFAAAPPPGAQPSPLWGNPAHVRTLLADRTIEVTAERRMLTVDRFATAEDPVRTAELDDALVELARRHDRGDGRVLMDWEYLLYVARKRG